MTTARRMHHTYAEYLALEAMGVTKHEFYDGEIYAMAGGTPEHSSLASKMLINFGRLLRPPCQAFNSDLRIRIEATGLSTYPDVTVVCGKLERSRADKDAVTNPIVVVEATSPSSADYDRGDKLSQYKQIPSLAHVIFLDHEAPRVTLVSRTPAGWVTTDARAGELLELEGLGLAIDVDSLYPSLAG